ncbi:AEC family transporter [Clostridium sp. BJN0001]|uniref:AEC family transporter n=1 Tax=Clostridium sp. BJN0001 TaxID=2930219 RepID=UPI001FD21D21|nr:AEC family transporter [Clostridium sp. BJN0001]
MTKYLFVTLNQIFVMSFIIAIGYVLYRKKIINDDGSEEISNFLIKVVTPCVIISSYQREFDLKSAKMLGLSFVVAIITFLIPIIISSVIFKNNKKVYKNDAKMCLIFSNDGFMAVPLLQSLLGTIGVFLGSAHIVVGTVIIWTYGVFMLSKDKKSINLKNIIFNVGTISMVFGILLFISPIKLPKPIITTFTYIANVNTPLAMIVLGVFLAQTDILSIIKDKNTYKICFYKLILIPSAILLCMYLLSVDKTVALVLIIGSAAPTAVIAAMFAKTFETEYIFSTKMIAATTIFSMITLPFFITLTQIIL